MWFELHFMTPQYFLFDKDDDDDDDDDDKRRCFFINSL